MSAKLDKIKEQIEYYLSDKNLEQDEYFRKEIESGNDVIYRKSLNFKQKLGICESERLPKMQQNKKTRHH